jgi:hypothetical protein
MIVGLGSYELAALNKADMRAPTRGARPPSCEVQMFPTIPKTTPVIIADIHNPLAEGPALLLLPEATLLRWPGCMNPPPRGAPYSGTVVDVSEKPDRERLAELLKTVVCARDQLARCDAARDLPNGLLVRFYSYQMVNQMQNVAQKILPEVRERLKEKPVSLYALTRAAYARTATGQLRRCKLL